MGRKDVNLVHILGQTRIFIAYLIIHHKLLHCENLQFRMDGKAPSVVVVPVNHNICELIKVRVILAVVEEEISSGTHEVVD